jgi:hypothetical protein
LTDVGFGIYAFDTDALGASLAFDNFVELQAGG